VGVSRLDEDGHAEAMKTLRLGLALSTSFLLACGPPSATELCARVAECEGAQSEPECVESVDEVRAEAEKAGCEDQYDDYLSCIDGVSDLCVEDALEQECLEEGVALFGCVGFDDDPQPDPPPEPDPQGG
jgi:hypothetical protein